MDQKLIMTQYFPLIYLWISHTLMSQCLVLMMHFITRANYQSSPDLY